MKYKVFGKTKLKAQLYGILKYDYFHYPHAEEGPYRVFGNGASEIDSLLWAYKCWIHQMEKAERGYGLEEFFANRICRSLCRKGSGKRAATAWPVPAI